MAARNLLHKSKLKSFGEWLTSDGWQLMKPLPGTYEVLRAKKQGKGILIVYRKDKTNNGNPIVHYSVADKWIPLLYTFMKSMKAGDDSGS
jgi:hypothetical protein